MCTIVKTQPSVSQMGDENSQTAVGGKKLPKLRSEKEFTQEEAY